MSRADMRLARSHWVAGSVAAHRKQRAGNTWQGDTECGALFKACPDVDGAIVQAGIFDSTQAKPGTAGCPGAG